MWSRTTATCSDHWILSYCLFYDRWVQGGSQKKILWLRHAARVPTAFLVLPNSHWCFYNSIETRHMFSISYYNQKKKKKWLSINTQKKNLANIQPTWPHAWSITYIYFMTSSVNEQDEPNLALWFATRAVKMELFCPLGIRALSHKEIYHVLVFYPI